MVLVLDFASIWAVSLGLLGHCGYFRSTDVRHHGYLPNMLTKSPLYVHMCYTRISTRLRQMFQARRPITDPFRP